jgi:hypothetical protein
MLEDKGELVMGSSRSIGVAITSGLAEGALMSCSTIAEIRKRLRRGVTA